MGLLAISTASFAKDPPPSPLMKELEGCRSIADASKRLACFDRVSGTLVGAAAKGDVVLVDRGQMRQARRSLFGFSLPKLPFFDGDKSGEDQSDELQSTITSLRSLPYGKYQFRIADGNALWETTEASSAVTPRNGDKVLIKRGALGSYIVKFSGSRAVKAKRVG
ncbi:MAG TPA: hypothetical protein VNA29_06455 [Sphingomicrobium sp.]|nr:hypothetical protein [Sphingomicrobium sp.]